MRIVFLFLLNEKVFKVLLWDENHAEVLFGNHTW